MTQSPREGHDEFSGAYSESSLWLKLRRFAAAAGREVVERALVLYYVLEDQGTPGWARAACIGALGYFIAPIDAIADLVPLVGYTDDLGVLVAALATVAKHITPEHRARATQKATEWFGPPAS
jgi:uncharacterized membrane protein YkvA (DUF1232 family)